MSTFLHFGFLSFILISIIFRYIVFSKLIFCKPNSNVSSGLNSEAIVKKETHNEEAANKVFVHGYIKFDLIKPLKLITARLNILSHTKKKLILLDR